MDPIAITEFLVQQGGLERGLSLDYNGKPNRLKGIHRANEFFLDYLPECSYSLSMRHNDPKITKAFSRYFQEVRGKQDEAGRGEFYEAEIEQGENGKGNENKTKSSLIYRVIDTFLRYFHIAEQNEGGDEIRPNFRYRDKKTGMIVIEWELKRPDRIAKSLKKRRQREEITELVKLQ